MRDADLVGAQRWRYRGTTRQDRQAVAAPDPVSRDFAASAPLNMAVWNRRPATRVVHHSDRDAQYTSLALSQRCRDAGMAPSMGAGAAAHQRWVRVNA
jgi:transposase InsO family protein